MSLRERFQGCLVGLALGDALGGDTDTLAAMTGALSGARLGLVGVPGRLVELLESSPRGRDYIVQLASRLHDAHLSR